MGYLPFGKKPFGLPILASAKAKSISGFRVATAASLSVLSAVTFAQEQATTLEELIVTGTRATIQDSIDLKRNSINIVDGLSADEIGAIPALSIGEALETLTGASSHRENGGATEVSIRGLGPFLTNTVVNGREATNGAGNRAVNFSIFPSELFNKIGIYKTQSASFIEGAVGGQVQLETKRPLDHGERSIQLSLKGAYNEDEQDVLDGQDLGHRATISFIDQFESDAGEFGVSLGVQVREESNPEQEFTRSGTPRICDLDDGIPTATTCSDNEFFLRDPSTPEEEREFAFLSSSAQFRQNQTNDERNSFFGAFQWQPNDRLDINLDTQWSERIQTERRSDLLFAELNRNLNPDLNDDGTIDIDDNPAADTVVIENGILQSFTNAGQEIQLLGQDFTRDEEYKGVGLNLEYQVNADLLVSFDASYSDTYRIENEESLRFGDEIERLVSADFSQSDVGIFGVTQLDGSAFDASDLGEFLRGATSDGVGSTAQDFIDAFAEDSDFDDRLRARVQEDIRENTLTAFRGDIELQTDELDFIHTIESGFRFSDMEYSRKGNINSDWTLTGLGGGSDLQAQALADITNNCVDGPLVDNFEEVSADQNALFLNYNSINAGCSLDIVRAARDGDPDGALTPNNTFNGSSVDVEESTFSFYVQGNYETELFGFNARGNLGVRVLRTEVDSRTFTAPFLLDVNDSGSFELDSPTNFNSGALSNALGDATFLSTTTDSHSYTEILPSATLILDLSDDVLLRAGVFRGLSRSDPAVLGSRQQVGTVQQDIIDRTEVTEAEADGTNLDDGDVLNITAEEIAAYITTQGQSGGAADLDPFSSWNLDLALEWYPNDDTVLSAGAYYKEFTGGYQNTFINSSFTIVDDGSTDTGDALLATGLFPEDGSIEITAPISSIETTDDKSSLYGLEVTASHSFSYLPGFMGGFGGKLSYNYANSDFEFEDDFAGAGVGLDENGDQVPLVGLVPPAEIFGLSQDVMSAQLYWSGGAFDAQAIYKYRSSYFQQYVETPGRIRYVDDNAVLEFRASYDVNDYVQLSFEALNLTNEPRVDYRGLDGNVVQVLSYGPRYFFGVRARF